MEAPAPLADYFVVVGLDEQEHPPADIWAKVRRDGHICEIQVVHTMLLSARKTLPGHDVYNRVRNAMELLEISQAMETALANHGGTALWCH